MLRSNLSPLFDPSAAPAVILLFLLGGFLLNGAVAYTAWRRGSLAPSGAVAGTMLGLALFAAGGFLFWCLMGAFFVSSTLLTRMGRQRKRSLERLHEKGGRRDGAQVLANGGAGLVAAILFAATGTDFFATALAAAFAEAAADTWASELGVLGRKRPVSILNLQPVEPGTSGGVSPAGTAASAAGAGFVAFVFAGIRFLQGVPIPRLLVPAVIIAAAGFAGALLDSVLGATVQAAYRDPETGEYTERRRSAGRPNLLIRGIPIMTNDAVNLAGTVSAAVLGGLLAGLLPG